MSDFEMKAVRYKTDEGVRNGLLVGQGPKWLKLILPEAAGVRVTEVPIAEAKFISDLDIPIKRAKEQLKVHARMVGCFKSAAEVLGIKPIEPPRDKSTSNEETKAVSKSIKRATKASDRKPKEKKAKVVRTPKAKGEPRKRADGKPGRATAARLAGEAYVKQHRLTLEKLADRSVSKEVREAMLKASPEVAISTLGAIMSVLKRQLADKKAA